MLCVSADLVLRLPEPITALSRPILECQPVIASSLAIIPKSVNCMLSHQISLHFYPFYVVFVLLSIVFISG